MLILWWANRWGNCGKEKLSLQGTTVVEQGFQLRRVAPNPTFQTASLYSGGELCFFSTDLSVWILCQQSCSLQQSVLFWLLARIWPVESTSKISDGRKLAQGRVGSSGLLSARALGSLPKATVLKEKACFVTTDTSIFWFWNLLPPFPHPPRTKVSKTCP